MYKSENYSVEDLLNEDLLNESDLDENLYDEDLDYEDFDESRSFRKKPSITRPIKGFVPGRVTQASNFGSRMTGNFMGYVTKIELKNKLDQISREVNELKKTSINTSKLITALDKKHTELAKIDLRRNDNQNTVLRNMQMMNMFGTLLNQPKLVIDDKSVVTNLITENVEVGKPAVIKVVDKSKNTIETDTMMSMMLPMMTTMGGNSGGGTDMMMPLMMVMMMDKDKVQGDKNSMLMVVMMLMMMNQKK